MSLGIGSIAAECNLMKDSFARLGPVFFLVER